MTNAWALKTTSQNGARATLTSGITIGNNVGDYIEISAKGLSGNLSDSYRLLSTATISSYVSLVSGGSSDFKLQSLIFSSGISPPPLNTVFTLKLTKYSISDWRITIDEQLVATLSTANNLVVDTLFGLLLEDRFTFVGEMYQLEASTNGGVPTNRWVNRTGVSETSWVDEISGNTAILNANFGSNYWEVYSYPITAVPEIILTSPSINNRLKQRDTNNKHEFTVGGEILNLPTNAVVEYKLDNAAWQILDQNPTSMFTGVVTVTSTQILTVRINNGGLLYESDPITLIAAARVLGTGQSNMVGQGAPLDTVNIEQGAKIPYMENSDGSFSPLADPTNTYNNGDGTWHPALFSLLANNNPDITYCFINNAKGSTSINDWLKTANDLYLRNTTSFNRAGGFEYHLMLLGETDTVNAMPQSEIETKYSQYANDIKNDFGANTYLINFPKSTLSNDLVTQAAFANLLASNVNILDGGNLRTLDIENTGGDGLHIQTEDQVNQAALIIYNAVSFIPTSTLLAEIQGIPDDTYMLRLFDNTDLIYSQNTQFSGGSASITLSKNIGSVVRGFVIDNETPAQTGAVIYGTTQ